MATIKANRNARRNLDAENKRVEFDRDPQRMMNPIIQDDNRLFRHFMENDGYRRWIADTTFGLATKKRID